MSECETETSTMAFEDHVENEVLAEFRNRVKDLNCSPKTLRRFLRARNHDLTTAENMLRNSMEWRQINKVDAALTWTISSYVIEKVPFEFGGVDYQNQLVVYGPLGFWPLKELLDEEYKEDLYKYVYVCLETLMAQVNKVGEKFNLIVDLAECTYWKFTHYETMQLFYKVLREFEANYPECLGECWVINAPFYFSYTFALLKPLLSGTTLSKITFLGGTDETYMPTLLERMPASAVPTALRKFLK